MIEQWNSANVAIHYGREAELPGSDREHQEISMLTLSLLQSALVLVNTHLVDRVLDDPQWARRLPRPTGAVSHLCSGRKLRCTAGSSWIWTLASTTTSAHNHRSRRTRCPSAHPSIATV